MRPIDEWAAGELARQHMERDAAIERYLRGKARAEWAKKHIPILGWLWYWFGGYRGN